MLRLWLPKVGNVSLVYKLYFLCVAWFGCGSFVGIAEGDAVEQLIALAEVQLLQVFGCFGLLHEAGRTAEAARTDTHGLCCEYHVASQQTTVYL